MHQSTRLNPGPSFECNGLRGPCGFVTYFILWGSFKKRNCSKVSSPRGCVGGFELWNFASLFLPLIVLLSCQISEMSKEVTKLKEALNSLSQLSYSTSSSKRQSQQLEVLQQQVKQLQNQLAVSGLLSAAGCGWGWGGRGRFHTSSAGRGCG